MGAFTIVQMRREVTLFRADIRKNTRIGRSLRAAVEAVWRTEGAVRAREMVEEADDENEGLGIRVVHLDALPSAAGVDAPALAALRAGEEARVVYDLPTVGRRRSTFLPLAVDDGKVALELFESLQEQVTFVRTTRVAIVSATLAVTIVSALIVMWLASNIVTRPIEQLRELARRIGTGDLSRRLTLRQRDEIGALAADLNAMCDLMEENARRLADETDGRLAALEQLRHTDRLATVGRLASAIAHQLGTPLSVVSMRAKMIATQTGADDAIAANARIVAEQADRMADSIRRLLDFSRRRSMARGRVDLRLLTDRTLDLVAPVAQRRHLRIERTMPETSVDVEVDGALLQQAITNIALNAFQAMGSGGVLRVVVGRRVVGHGEQAPVEHAFVELADDGPGIAPEQYERLFEPFFTTKPVGEGTGLGLPVADGIVRDHDGWITVDSEPGAGARFTIFLAPAVRALEDAS